MDATSRRESILVAVNQSTIPLSASLLAENLNVSRQLVVGDIAILRAQGHEIIATARGYTGYKESKQFLRKIACQHTPDDTRKELYIIVDLDAAVVSVTVEHEMYGEITGQLNIKDREDVDLFIKQLESSEVKLLSELTAGIHLHTIACRDKDHFEQVCQSLDAAGYLYKN